MCFVWQDEEQHAGYEDEEVVRQYIPIWKAGEVTLINISNEDDELSIDEEEIEQEVSEKPPEEEKDEKKDNEVQELPEGNHIFETGVFQIISIIYTYNLSASFLP